VPAGSFAAGALAALFGAPATLALMGATLVAIAALAVARLPSVRAL
jgi:hypothetical protein